MEPDDKPGYVVCNHLSRNTVACELKRSTQKRDGPPHSFLSDLASNGVYTALSVTSQAVVSYTAFSPLPRTTTHKPCAFAHYSWFRAVILCCTFPGSPPPDVIRHPALRSPDFPHLTKVSRDYISCSIILIS